MPLLANLDIVLVRPRFPENIGMTARACANMGAGSLSLVAPERWAAEDIVKARSLATSQGEELLARPGIFGPDQLGAALAGASLAIGTTARTGGWRRHLLNPEQAALALTACCAEGEKCALVFGPENCGLSNEESELCNRLVCIPTAGGAASLNLAQAVLLLLYECRKAASDKKFASFERADTRRASHEEQERLLGHIKQLLLQIDSLHGDNPDYFFLPVRRFFGRSGLRRHEYDLLMGVCRQLQARLGKKAKDNETTELA